MATDFKVAVTLVSGRGGRSPVAKQFDQVVDSGKKAKGSVEGVTAGLRNLWRLAGGLGLGAIFAGMVKASADGEKAVAQLEASIKSTGGVAGFTSKQMQTLSAQLQRTTGISDDLTNQMLSVLLTFTNVRDQVPRAAAVIQDIAEKMGTSLQSAAVQVGKALNDPVANLSALGEAGIQFSKAQQRVIKDLATTGQLSKAQALILEELENQFGDTAVTARDTFAGALKALGAELNDLAQQGGDTGTSFIRTLVEPIVKGLQFLNDNWDSFRAATFRTIGQVTDFLAGFVAGAIELFRKLAGATAELGRMIDRALPGDQSAMVKGVEAAETKLAALAATVRQFGDDIKSGMEDKAEAAIDAQIQAWKDLETQVVSTAGAVKGDMAGALDVLVERADAARRASAEAMEAWRDGLERQLEILDEIRQESVKANEEWIDGIKRAEEVEAEIREGQAEMERAFQQGLEDARRVERAWNNAWTNIADLAGEVAQAWEEGFLSTGEAITEIFEGVGSEIASALAAAGKQGAAQMAAAIASVAGNLGGIFEGGRGKSAAAARAGFGGLGLGLGAAFGGPAGAQIGAAAGQAFADILIGLGFFRGSRGFAGQNVGVGPGGELAATIDRRGNQNADFEALDQFLEQALDTVNSIFDELGLTLSELGSTVDLMVQDEAGLIVNINGIQRVFGDNLQGAIAFLATSLAETAQFAGLSADAADAVRQAAADAGDDLEAFAADVADIQAIVASASPKLPEIAQRLQAGLDEFNRLLEQAGRFGLDTSGLEREITDFIAAIRNEVLAFRRADPIQQIRDYYGELRRQALAINAILRQQGRGDEQIDIGAIDAAQRGEVAAERRRREQAREEFRRTVASFGDEGITAEIQGIRDRAEEFRESIRGFGFSEEEIASLLADIDARVEQQLDAIRERVLAGGAFMQSGGELEQLFRRNRDAWLQWADELAQAAEAGLISLDEQERALTAGRRQRRQLNIQAAESFATSTMIELLELLGEDERVAQLTHDLKVAELKIAIAQLRIAQRRGLIDADVVDELEHLLMVFMKGPKDPKDPPAPGPDIEDAGDYFRNRVRESASILEAAMQKAQGIADQIFGLAKVARPGGSVFADALAPFDQLLFQIQHLSTDELLALAELMNQAFGLGLPTTPGFGHVEDVLAGLEDFLGELAELTKQEVLEKLLEPIQKLKDSLLLDPSVSPLSAEEKFGVASDKINELFAAILGGDLSLIDDFDDAVNAFLAALQGVTPKGSGFFDEQFALLQEMLDVILGLTPKDAEAGIPDVVDELRLGREQNQLLLTEIRDLLRNPPPRVPVGGFVRRVA